MRTTPFASVRSVLGVAVLLAAVWLGGSQPALAATGTPTKLRAVEQAQTAIELDWDAVAGAPRYRIAIATRSDMSNATYHRFTPSAAEITGLKPGTTYYVKVRVITDDGANLSAYSPAVKVSTASVSGYRYLSPNDLSATTGSTTAQLTWTGRASGVRYRIQYAASAEMADPTYRRFTPTVASIPDLQTATRYWFRVRVIDADGHNLSSYSPALSAMTQEPTAKTSSAPLRVGSYNVRCANCYSAVAEELPWSGRRDAVVATIKAQDVDVIGVQEASQAWLKDAGGASIDRSQFEDLQQRLGSPWTLVNGKRNNCVKDTTPTNCVYADQGASQGTKVLYNADRLELLSGGSKLLPSVDATNNARYVAWALLKQRSTGQEFFFADTHLEYRDDTAGSTRYSELRQAQAAEVLATITRNNPDGRPVILVGDFNSSRFAVPTNAPYDAFVGGGLLDSLGQTYRSTKTAPGATVEHRVNTWLSSYNDFQRQAGGRRDWVNGSNIDYILTSRMRVAEWETVARLNSSDQFVGTIPSDHNMIRATVYLP